MEPMRIATWNVNSLNARLPKVLWWLERAKPDVLLMQETKLADDAVPSLPFREAGYALAHHGQGRWNGVAIASRCGIDGVIENFGKPLSRPAAPDVDEGRSRQSDFVYVLRRRRAQPGQGPKPQGPAEPPWK